MKPSETASPARVRAARERLDAWTREVVEWHFDPETGSPFWLERARSLGLDPIAEVKGFADLARLGPFQEDWLRGGPVERWIPRGAVGRAVRVFEVDSAGPGAPARPLVRIDIDDLRIDYSIFSETLPDESFPRGSDWVAIAPTGPRRLRHALEHLAHVRGGICFGLDLDPRWVSRCLGRGWAQAAEAYQEHVIDQALTIIRAHPGIRCLYASPRLIEALCDKVSLRHVGITGVVCGGALVAADFHRRLREEMLQGAAFVPTYGGDLMGIACPEPFSPEEGHAITYHAPQPRAVLEVVDPDRPDRAVACGERGLVKLTTLTKELLNPGLLTREEATRTPPIELYPWDGVGDVRPSARLGPAAAGG
ncbi:MAG: hypothetical protein HY721_32675 [Planctomycetes bacterium]|nr:hypothetical protein [Planctomycetota bacterium]